MSSIDLRSRRPAGSPAAQPGAAPRGSLGRIVVASLATGGVAAAVLVLLAFPGATEAVTTGVALLAFAAGWAMLAALSARRTGFPQRWAYGLAGFLGAAGLALVTLAPDDDALTAAAWAWPPAVVILVAWSVRRARTAMPGRTRWLLYPVLAVLTIASIGALVQNVAAHRETNALTMPGKLYDVGGHRLHMVCTGAGSPTVVLESGLGGSSPLWARIANGVAPTTRVCAYDRAGIGWSDDAARAQDSVAVADDLHRLLSVSGENGPYVLVGHSVGGAYVMTYAARFPAQVAGMVLLDAASPWQFTVLPKYSMQYAMITRLYGVLPSLVRLGTSRLVPTLTANDVPGDAGEQATTFANAPRSASTARDELSTYHRTFAQAQALTTLGNKPLIVLSASDTLTDTAGWAAAQQRLAALSGNAGQRTVHSSHEGLLEDATASTASVTAIVDVVRAVRADAPVRTR